MIVFSVRSSIEKTAQAAAVLVKLAGGRIDRLRLLKLLYIADRDSIESRGAPIIGGRVSAADHGPVNSTADDVIGVFFKIDGATVALNDDDPGTLDLSPFEVAKLTETHKRFNYLDSWLLAEQTKEFAEWKNCKPVAGSPNPIPYEKILAAVGFTSSEIRKILSEEDADRRFRRALCETGSADQ